MNELLAKIWPAAVRAGRTFLQAFLGVYLAGLFGGSAGLDGLVDVGLLETAAAAGLVALLSFTQNQLENTGKIPVNMTLASSNKH